MIECVTENVYYTKKTKRKKKRRFKIFLFLLIAVAFFVYYREVVTKNVINICSDKCAEINVKSVNGAISKTLGDDVLYDDLIKVVKNADGDIAMISANSYKMNDLSRKAVTLSQIILEENLKNSVKIPALAFTGLTFLSGYGRETQFNALTVSCVSCDFSSNFTSVGINQTLHSIYAVIESEIKIDFPLNSQTESYKTKVLLCEAVLVGKVPEIYLNGGLFNKS